MFKADDLIYTDMAHNHEINIKQYIDYTDIEEVRSDRAGDSTEILIIQQMERNLQEQMDLGKD